MSAERELRAETTVAASPLTVWTLLTDLRRMSDWSPELVAMLPVKPGGLRKHQWYVGINRRKLAIWPTWNVVAVLDAAAAGGRALAWDTKTSGARWIFEVLAEGEGTRVVHRRPVPRRLTLLSRLGAPLALGGSASHADELEAGMQQTVDRLRVAAES